MQKRFQIQEGTREAGRRTSPSLTRLNKPPMKTCSITRHREAEFRHVFKLPEERKARQVLPSKPGVVEVEAFV